MAMAALPVVDLRTRREWRAWLQANHASSAGVWLVRHRQHTGVTSVAYEDLVSEALCFGWIDSLVKRPETRERRIREALALLAAGRKLGVK